MQSQSLTSAVEIVPVPLPIPLDGGRPVRSRRIPCRREAARTQEVFTGHHEELRPRATLFAVYLDRAEPTDVPLAQYCGVAARCR